MTTRCYIALGSNLEGPAQQLKQALTSLSGHWAISLNVCSRFYASKAIGPGSQGDYANAVVAIDTTLSPEALLDTLQSIEHAQGRTRDIRWGPRTLDLDILLYGTLQLDSPRLTLPHPRLAERAFVLVPLTEIAPDLQLPDGTCVASLLDYASTGDVWPLQIQDGV